MTKKSLQMAEPSLNLSFIEGHHWLERWAVWSSPLRGILIAMCELQVRGQRSEPCHWWSDTRHSLSISTQQGEARVLPLVPQSTACQGSCGGLCLGGVGVGGVAQGEASPGTCWGANSVGSCRLMKSRRPAAPNSSTDENMQASRMVLACWVFQGTRWGHLWGSGGPFFLHHPHQASIRPRSAGQRVRVRASQGVTPTIVGSLWSLPRHLFREA